MRDYGKVSPKFWIGTTGKALRGDQPAQILSMYLITCPGSEMTGIYYLSIASMAHETGLTNEGAYKALQRLIEVGFCTYEEASETIFVHEMAAFQIGDALKRDDKRIIGLHNWFSAMVDGKIKDCFFERYKSTYFLDEIASPLKAPSKPRAGTRTRTRTGEGTGKTSKASAEPSPLPDWVPTDAWDSFVAMRKKIKKPLTDEAVRLAVKKLEELRGGGHDPRAVLEQSVLNSWQGLFEVKQSSSTKSSGSRQEALEAHNRAVAARLAGATS